jgi:ankyrin repeat protein
MTAILNNRLALVEWLLTQSPSKPSALAKDEKGRGLHELAAVCKEPDRMRELLVRCGVPIPDAFDLLHTTAQANDLAAMTKLLARTAPRDSAARAAQLNARDGRGWTVLMCAVEKRHLDMTRLLLTEGASAKELGSKVLDNPSQRRGPAAPSKHFSCWDQTATTTSPSDCAAARKRPVSCTC